MKKSAPCADHGALETGLDLQPAGLAPSCTIPFRIEGLRRCEFGAKKATFVVIVAGLGELNAEFFAPADRPPFVCSESIRSKFTGQFVRSAKFEDAFRAELLQAVLARLEAEEGRQCERP